MKKILSVLVISFLLLMGINEVQAQITRGTYSLSLEWLSLGGNIEMPLTFHVYTNTGIPYISTVDGRIFFFDWTGPPSSPPPTMGRVTHKYIQRPFGIMFDAPGFHMPGIPYTIDEEAPFIIDRPIERRDGVEPVFGWAIDATFRMSLLPTEFRFYYHSSTGITEITNSTALSLTNGSNTTIWASSGFRGEVYNWQYSLDIGNTWRNFPEGLQHNNSISFSSSDLFPSLEAFREFVRSGSASIIKVRINTPTYNTRHNISAERVVRLTPQFSSPRIQGIIVQPETIYGANDASATITLDRELYEGEVVRIWRNDRLGEGDPHANITRYNIGPGNSITIDSLSPGEVTFSITGVYNGNPTYSGSGGHWTTYYIRAQTRVEPDITRSNISCFGRNDGQITVTAVGGTGDYFATLFIRNGNNLDSLRVERFTYTGRAEFLGLSPGEYEVRVIDSNGGGRGNSKLFARIDEPEQLEATVTGEIPPPSYGLREGWVQLRVRGGTGAYTATLRAPNGDSSTHSPLGNGYTFEFSELAAGTYTVTVRDANDCTFDLSFTLTALVNHEITHRQHVSCYGGRDGQITVRAFGGTGNFTARLYERPLWGDDTFWGYRTFLQSDSAVFSGLRYGTYVVRVVDTDGRNSQSTNVSDTIRQPLQLTVAVQAYTQPLAHESQDGMITVRVGGGTKNAQGGYTVTLYLGGQPFSPASHSVEGNYVLYTFVGLSRGDYTISVRDGNDCPASLTFTLNAPPPLIVTIEEINPIRWYGAPQGELLARATGGVPFEANMPYTFTWYREVDGVMQPLAIPNDSIATNLFAGLYQVRVTDANGISRTSAPHYLTEPNPIEVEFVVVTPDCYGTRGGSITALVSGGFPPFRFEWCVEGATGNQLTSLEAGTYRLVVTDTRGGRNDSFIEVPPAGNLIINSQVIQPTCLAPEGSVTLTLSGAEPPFSVRWLDRDEVLTVAPNETITRGGLISGTYTVQVTDGNGCRNTFSFYIEALPEFTVSIGNDLVMNRNQSRTIEAISNKTNLTYLWYFNDTRLPDIGSSIVVDRAGDFTVIATNEQGCTATDRINVRMTNYILDLDMTAPTKVEVGSEVHAVNLSTMAADRIEWIVPDGTTIIEQSDTRLVFKFNQTGRHTISMEGFRGEGATIVTQTIEVVGVGEVTLPDGEDSLIRQFWASPSPSTGEFRVLVELNRPGDFTMRLYSPDGVLMDTREGRNVESQTFDYEIAGILQGTFVLHLITNVDKSVLQIVIRR